MINIFASRQDDHVALQGQYVLSGISEGRQTRNYSVMLTYQALSGLLPFCALRARYHASFDRTPLTGCGIVQRQNNYWCADFPTAVY